MVVTEAVTELEAKPCLVRHNVTLHISVSIGVAVYQRGMTVETLVQQADQAMYQAKLQGSGKTKVVFYGN